MKYGQVKNESGDGLEREFITIYIKVWKCGNNQIRQMERQLFDNLQGEYIDHGNLAIIMNHLRIVYRH